VDIHGGPKLNQPPTTMLQGRTLVLLVSVNCLFDLINSLDSCSQTSVFLIPNNITWATHIS